MFHTFVYMTEVAASCVLVGFGMGIGAAVANAVYNRFMGG